MKKGALIVAEGSDGAGSGTVIQAIYQYITKKREGNVLDLTEYKGLFPGKEELKRKDINCIRTREPTDSFSGAVIRKELVRKEKGYQYSALATAMAFSLDREILYKRTLGPALDLGSIILQERNVLSSLIYQPIHDELFGTGELSFEQIATLPGNAYVLEHHVPDLLIISQASAEEVMKRLEERVKQDDCEYEQIEFQRKVIEMYQSEKIRTFFEAKGTRVEYLNTEKLGSSEKTEKAATDLIDSFLKEKLL